MNFSRFHRKYARSTLRLSHSGSRCFMFRNDIWYSSLARYTVWQLKVFPCKCKNKWHPKTFPCSLSGVFVTREKNWFCSLVTKQQERKNTRFNFDDDDDDDCCCTSFENDSNFFWRMQLLYSLNLSLENMLLLESVRVNWVCCCFWKKKLRKLDWRRLGMWCLLGESPRKTELRRGQNTDKSLDTRNRSREQKDQSCAEKNIKL